MYITAASLLWTAGHFSPNIDHEVSSSDCHTIFQNIITFKNWVIIVSVIMSLCNCGSFSSNIQESSSDYIIISLKSHLQKLSYYHLWPLQQYHSGLLVHSHLSYKQCNTIVINSEVTPSEAESITFVSLWVPSCFSS